MRVLKYLYGLWFVSIMLSFRDVHVEGYVTRIRGSALKRVRHTKSFAHVSTSSIPKREETKETKSLLRKSDDAIVSFIENAMVSLHSMVQSVMGPENSQGTTIALTAMAVRLALLPVTLSQQSTVDTTAPRSWIDSVAANAVPLLQAPVNQWMYRALNKQLQRGDFDESFLCIPNLQGPSIVHSAPPLQRVSDIVRGKSSLSQRETAGYLTLPVALLVLQCSSGSGNMRIPFAEANPLATLTVSLQWALALNSFYGNLQTAPALLWYAFVSALTNNVLVKCARACSQTTREASSPHRRPAIRDTRDPHLWHTASTLLQSSPWDLLF